MFTPIGNQVYANFPEVGGLCRWAGDHFEPATKEEQERLDGISHLIERNFDNIGGWSKRAVGPGGQSDELTVSVGGDLKLSIKNTGDVNTGYAYGSMSVTLLRPGHPPEVIYTVDNHPRRVTRTEYRRLFSHS